GGGQIGEGDLVLGENDALCVAPSAAIKAAGLQREADQAARGVPVLRVEVFRAPAEDLSFQLALDAQTLPRVQSAEAPLEHYLDLRVHAHSGWPGLPAYDSDS